LALANLNGGLVIDSGGTHALLDLSGHGQEGLLDVAGVLGGCLQERDTDAVGKFLVLSAPGLRDVIVPAHLGNGVLDSPLIRHIALVADQELIDTFGGVAVDFLQPLLDVVEGIHVSHIVDNADAVGASVVGRSNGTESLLTGGIPLSHVSVRPSQVRVVTYDLELDSLAIKFDGSDFLLHWSDSCVSSGVHRGRRHGGVSRTKSTPMVEI
jgi:hypothetical protein